MPEPSDLGGDEEWSEIDLRELRLAMENGHSIEKAARFLCRVTAMDEVAHKVFELGLKQRPKPRRKANRH
ncbi:hypothetical protein [uncultured Methylovirgula sp.]|uniref:hypothetical protein n=1 Tax=uncultured Methylovirgula sp. TaxID=1285960 RepID=UPI00260F7A6D|nr:hypothetical protein [uncultured Methylovirgula sp.]